MLHIWSYHLPRTVGKFVPVLTGASFAASFRREAFQSEKLSILNPPFIPLTHTSPSSVVLSARCSSQRIQTSPVWNLWNLYFSFQNFPFLKVTKHFLLQERIWSAEAPFSDPLCPCCRTRTCLVPAVFCLVKQIWAFKGLWHLVFFFLVTQALEFDWGNNWKAQKAAPSLCRRLALMKLRNRLEEDG